MSQQRETQNKEAVQSLTLEDLASVHGGKDKYRGPGKKLIPPKGRKPGSYMTPRGGKHPGQKVPYPKHPWHP